MNVMKIKIFMIAQWLGWISCLGMTWMSQRIYFIKDDPLGAIFCLLLGILFSLIMIHLFLFRFYEEQQKTRHFEAMQKLSEKFKANKIKYESQRKESI